jgi:predicted 2-oxoglutarate/Fe(II)-dependent dioxygenase YbiX
MTLSPVPNNAPVLVIDDMYTEEELRLIWNELEFLTSPKRLLDAKSTNAATGDDGQYVKTATGVYLDEFYGNRKFSDILAINRKLFSDEIYNHAINLSIFYGLLRTTNNDHTLINYYDNSQEYAAHVDGTVFTAVTTFFKEPAQFEGGDFVFPQVDLVVEKKHNRLVMFPGSLQHAVTPVKMSSTYPPFSGYGRYAMAQFLTVK